MKKPFRQPGTRERQRPSQSETKTVCPYCKRAVGGWHLRPCPRSWMRNR